MQYNASSRQTPVMDPGSPRAPYLRPRPSGPGHSTLAARLIQSFTPSLFLLPCQCGERQEVSFQKLPGTQVSYLDNPQVLRGKKKKTYLGGKKKTKSIV